ncbi:MAG: hypothetical protein P1V97_35650, partial [Planctomycetota bacterium]|nr:hypothetical protein [Planctomycetota bacterium]
SHFQRQELHPPSDWPSNFEAIGWSEQGVVLINGQRRFFISDEREFSSEKKINFSNQTKKTANYLFNGIVATGEIGLFIPGNLALAGTGLAILPFLILPSTIH